MDDYRRDRNVPGLDRATSRLSPYLAAGAISPRRCLTAALAATGRELDDLPPDAAAWTGELAWREFFRHVLVGHPHVSRRQPFREIGERVVWRVDPAGLEAWQEGRTGVPIVDAGMRELAATGWMHNRARMVAAQFLTKDLLIDWRHGERHFMRSLVDADLANNNGGWQWAASTGTDAAPYFRIFNPWKQSQRVDPDGGYIRRYVPELEGLAAEHLHTPGGAAVGERRRRGYPAPIIDHRRARMRALAAWERAAGLDRERRG